MTKYYERFNSAGIPGCLGDFKQWVGVLVFSSPKSESDFMFLTPFQRQNIHADIDDPKTWRTCLDAVYALKHRPYFKPVCSGFALTESDPFAVIQIDDCRVMATGQIKDWAPTLMDRMESYCEVMPLNRGIRIFVKDLLPGPARRRGGVEMYDHGRFVPIMGDPVEGFPIDIEDRQDELEWLYWQLFGSDHRGPTYDNPCGIHPMKNEISIPFEVAEQVLSDLGWVQSKAGLQLNKIRCYLDGNEPVPINSSIEDEMALLIDLTRNCLSEIKARRHSGRIRQRQAAA